MDSVLYLSCDGEWVWIVYYTLLVMVSGWGLDSVLYIVMVSGCG